MAIFYLFFHDYPIYGFKNPKRLILWKTNPDMFLYICIIGFHTP